MSSTATPRLRENQENTHSNLRERQKNSTHDEIVSTAMSLLRETGHFTHEEIAERTGMSARTVYRHFPSRDQLIAATWQRLKEDTETRFPQNEEEILELGPELYRNLHRHEELVRAFLFSGVGSEVRDQGAKEGRAAFQKALRSATKHLSPQQRNRVVAVFLALYSAPAWQLMRDRGELSPSEATHAIHWALTTLLDSLHAGQSK